MPLDAARAPRACAKTARLRETLLADSLPKLSVLGTSSVTMPSSKSIVADGEAVVAGATADSTFHYMEGANDTNEYTQCE